MSEDLRGWFAPATGEHPEPMEVFFSTVVDPSVLWSPSFASLVKLMIDGLAAGDHLIGEVSARIDQPVMDFSYRIARRGDLVRCEALDGRVHFIAGRDSVWSRGASDELVAAPRTGAWFSTPDDFEFGSARPTEARWAGDDFTIPTGPEIAVTFLGRPAWQVELAPPPHKPEPMQMIIDAETGLILREGNLNFDTFHEWTSLDTNAALPDNLFEFNPSSDVPASPLDGGSDPDPDRERHVRDRLELLDALLAAAGRRHEVVDLIAESESAEEARASLRALLGVSELGATAILDLQFRRLAKLERSRLVEDRDSTRRELSS